MSKEKKEKKEKQNKASEVDSVAEEKAASQANADGESADKNADKNSESLEKNDTEKNETEKLKEEIAKQKELHLRTAAEYANFRSRTEKEKLEIYSNATVSALQAILPIADSIDLALMSSENASDDYKKGLELIKAQIDKAFSALGAESYGERGDEFDPQLYSAIGHVEDEELGENTVAQVLQKGYKCKDKIVRYCMVQVAN